ncbi:MAG: hypothetical protein H7235_11925, partial [Bdellovibrionaceae bacterium]|nr:hypothetical protein [Pseudobdellovibrionaceae bacterium]
MKNLKITLFLCAFILTPNVGAEEIFKNFSEDRFDSYFSANYFKSTANYSSQGTQTGLASGSSYQITDVNILGRYVPYTDLGTFVSFNVGNSEATDLVATRRNSTLNIVTLGVDYQIYKSNSFSSYVDFSYGYAVEKFKVDTDSSLNSDGADQIKVQMTAIYNFDSFSPYARGGINYRREGLSTLMTYGAGVEMHFDQVALGAGLDGYLTIKDDTNTNQAYARDFVTTRVSAGSKRFYGINPNSLDSDIYMKFGFDKDISFKINGGYTLLGSNSAVGFHLGGAFAWSFGDETKSYSRPAPRRTAPAVKERRQQPQPVPQKRFEEDTNDGVNQDYFKPVQPSKDDYIQQMDDDHHISTKPLPGAKVKKAVPEPPPEGYEVKLKKKKRK